MLVSVLRYFVQQYVIGAERWSKWFEPSDFTGNIVLWSFKRLCDFKWNNFPFPPQVSRINSCLWVWVAMLQNFFQVNNFPPQVSSCNHSSSIVVMGVSFNAAKPADLVASPSSTVSYLRSCANTWLCFPRRIKTSLHSTTPEFVCLFVCLHVLGFPPQVSSLSSVTYVGGQNKEQHVSDGLWFGAKKFWKAGFWGFLWLP